MSSVIQAATFIPLRESDGILQLFMTQRAYWNGLEHRPMRFPGEWVFAGGGFDQKMGDRTLEDTACREFSEETGYRGRFARITPVRNSLVSSRGRMFHVQAYAGLIDKFPRFTPSKEIIGYDWRSSTQWLDLLNSQSFEEFQRERFDNYGLGADSFGKHSVRAREKPVQVMRTLEYLQERSALNTIRERILAYY